MPDADTLITADDVIANVDNNNTFGNDLDKEALVFLYGPA